MTIIDESPTTLLRAQGIAPLNERCPHRFPDGTSGWTTESRVGRMGIYSVFVCRVCGAGAEDAEGAREAVRECVDDR